MQRLYFTFPNAWPGAGLLLLRLGQVALFVCANDWNSVDGSWLPLLLIGGLTSGLVAVGLWTPIAGVTLAITQAISAYWHLPQSHLAVALVGMALAMLGPGSWSIDARVFGRRRVSIEDYDSSPSATSKRR